MGGKRKRPRHESNDQIDNKFGVADTLSLLRGTDRGKDLQNKNDGDWETVESKHSKKRRRQEESNYPAISHSANARLQSFVKIGDLQGLALYLLADGNAPQWCSVRHHHHVRKVVVVMVPGLEAGMFDGTIPIDESPDAMEVNSNVKSSTAESINHDAQRSASRLHVTPDDYYPVKLQRDRLPEPLQPFADMFEHMWPIKTPGDDKFARMYSPLSAMLSAPIVKPREEKKAKGPQPPPGQKGWQSKRTPVTELLATAEELAEDGYVLHPAHFAETKLERSEAEKRVAAHQSTAHGWVDTLNIPNLAAGDAQEEDIEQGSIVAGRKVLTIDCEMCLVSPPGETQIFRLTRVTVINWDGEVVIDRLVKPSEPITDYLTPYSGITAAMLEGVTTTLADVQKELLSIITPQTVLVGHSLNSDFNALQITHPYIIDTAILYPHPRGPPLKSSLKWLSQKYLTREIQKGHGSTGHDSVEDARATLDLVKQKCEKGKAWGTPEAHSESIFTRLSRSYRPKRDMVHPHGDDEPRRGAVVDWGDPTRGYGSAAAAAIGCETDDDVVAGIERALTGDDSDAPVVPKGGCDFIWARFRSLEARRGWWNRTKAADSEVLRSNTTSSVEAVPLRSTLTDTVRRISQIYAALPRCSAIIVYSGTGDPRELTRMQDMQRTFKEEYKTKKWDELSVRWTDDEEQKLRRACEMARRGIGFIAVK